MYEVWRVGDSRRDLVERARDFETAKARAIEASVFQPLVFVVIRQGFGQPLVYAHNGALLANPLDVIGRITVTPAPTPAPAPVPETGEDESVAPRSRRRGPSELKGKAQGPQRFKQFDTQVTAIDDDQGIVEAIVSVFGVLDEGDDVIHPGAFIKTLAENGHRIKVLDSHNNRSALNVIGRPLEIREVGRDELPPGLLARHPEATGGLYTKTQFLLTTPEGRGVFERIKGGLLEYSIGFDTMQEDQERAEIGGEKHTVRNIRQVRLWEYSPVVFGMNQATTTVSVKEASGAADLPLADRGRNWDAAGAARRVRAWASDGDEVDWAKYRKAFFWYDSENAETVGAHRLGFADVIDGTLTAIPRGIFAVAAVLQGGRGGVDIPAEDVTAVKRRVERYYARMRDEFEDDGIRAPWIAEEEAHEGPGEAKEGRVLLAANFNRIRQAYDLLHEVMQQAGLLEDGADEQSAEDQDQQKASNGPSGGQNAPTPENKAESAGAGPQAQETPSGSELVSLIEQRLTELESLQ